MFSTEYLSTFITSICEQIQNSNSKNYEQSFMILALNDRH